MNLLDKAGAVYEALMAATGNDIIEASAVLQIINTMLGYDQTVEMMGQKAKQNRDILVPPGRM